MKRARIAVIGHVEHVTLGRIDAAPHAGDVLHLRAPKFVPAGGGGIAFAQLCRSDAEVHFFTALGDDPAAEEVRARLAKARDGVHVHAAHRAAPHPRVVVMVDPNAARTIVVTGEPLQATSQDSLPWDVLATCDAVYFTGADPGALTLARASRCLVATARRRPVIANARIAPNVIVGSINDPRENAAFHEYTPAPDALVMTDSANPIRITRAHDESLVAPNVVTHPIVGDYGAGDSFAGALTYFLAHACTIDDAAKRATAFGAAVLAGIDPLESQAELAFVSAS